MSEQANVPAGQRRPKDGDLEPILDLIWNGKSLRAACLEIGLHTPSTSDWLHADDGRREQYARAREGRAEFLQEDAVDLNRVAALGGSVGEAKVDASGAKGYLEAVKWSTARMAPKTAPREHHVHSFEDLSDAELDAKIASREATVRGAATRADKAEYLALLDERDRRLSLKALKADAAGIRSRCHTLAGFVREAWNVLEPSTPYVHNWHIDAMCAHLEAVTTGKINRLLINVPPGSSKSMIVSVLWPAWEWGPRSLRSMRYLTTSFAEGNVKRDTRKHRDLTLSDWYQALWPMALPRTAEMSFANAETGTREGVAFGSLTSRRGDRLIIDDPHSVDTAESESERVATTRRFREGATNRLNDQEKSAIVVVMQRLHQQDVAGTIIKLGMGYTHLMLPMEYEAGRTPPSNIFSDPRETDGDLMDPVRFPRKVVEDLRRDMGAYAYAGQYQQRPAPRDGGMFKRSWFATVHAVPAGAKRVRRWDLAATVETAGSDPDWTVGLLMARDDLGFYYIEDIIRFRGTSMDVERAILNTAHQDRAAYGEVEIGLPQDPGQAGKSQVAHLIRMLAGFVVRARPETGSKEVRAAPLAAQAEAGNVRLVDRAWNITFLDEAEVFPNGAHDDQVDPAAGAFDMLTIPAGHRFTFA